MVDIDAVYTDVDDSNVQMADLDHKSEEIQEIKYTPASAPIPTPVRQSQRVPEDRQKDSKYNLAPGMVSHVHSKNTTYANPTSPPTERGAEPPATEKGIEIVNL